MATQPALQVLCDIKQRPLALRPSDQGSGGSKLHALNSVVNVKLNKPSDSLLTL